MFNWTAIKGYYIPLLIVMASLFFIMVFPFNDNVSIWLRVGLFIVGLIALMIIPLLDLMWMPSFLIGLMAAIVLKYSFAFTWGVAMTWGYLFALLGLMKVSATLVNGLFKM